MKPQQILWCQFNFDWFLWPFSLRFELL